MDLYSRTDPISVLNLSDRLQNLLGRNGIRTMGALMDAEESQWKNTHGIGAKSVKEIHEALESLRPQSDENQTEASDVQEEMSDSLSEKNSPCIFYETPIEYWDSSIKLQRCLQREEIDSIGKFLDFPQDKWASIRGMNERTMKEVPAMVQSIKALVGEHPAHVPELNEEDIILCKELEEAYGIDDARIPLVNIKYKHPDCTGETLIYRAYDWNSIQDAFYHKILGLLHEYGHGLSLEQISCRLPKHLQNTTILEQAILSLQNDDKIQEADGVYILKYPSFMKYLSGLPDEKNREIVIQRLSGETLEEIGARFGLTRERVRQICKKTCIRHKRMEEDQYRYPFETYEVDEKSFLAIFHVPVTTYHYLETVCKV